MCVCVCVCVRHKLVSIFRTMNSKIGSYLKTSLPLTLAHFNKKKIPFKIKWVSLLYSKLCCCFFQLLFPLFLFSFFGRFNDLDRKLKLSDTHTHKWMYKKKGFLFSYLKNCIKMCCFWILILNNELLTLFTISCIKEWQQNTMGDNC